jgi:nucleotide-binding universal stress UspA family protein
MIPVDLAHADKLDKALSIGTDLAKHYGADLHLVGVTDVTPGAIAHNPQEYSEKLEAFAAEQGGARGIAMRAKMMTSHDPAIDVDDKLKEAAAEIGADLVVMASHVPGMADYVFHSRAGWLASHSDLSVLVVR